MMARPAILRLFLSAALAALLLSPLARAQTERWIPLFNGTDLAGWEHVGPGRFVLENGVLRSEGGMGLLWYAPRKLGNGVLRVVYKPATRKSNAGVFIRIPAKPVEPWTPVNRGFEVQILDDSDEYHSTGVLYSLTKALARPGRAGDWNTMEIALEGGKTTVTVNGQKVTDYTDGQTVPPKTKWYEPDRGPRPEEGYIGLQNHSNDDVVYFKEISFRPLLPSGQSSVRPLHVIAFGAHPDDCDSRAGGLAAKYAALGHKVRFVSVTNGDAGHQTQGGGALAARRRAEAIEAGLRIGIEYVVLDNHDGELLPTLAVREQIIRQMREWDADLVLAPRPNDYHPDHRYTGILVQDAAYMVTVPNIAPDTPALRKNPVFMYYQDGFQKPAPFTPDIAVSIDDVIEKKIDMLDAHVSQMYEWLPWHDGALDRVPADAAARRKWLRDQRTGEITPAVRAALVTWYGPERGKTIQQAEAFEICEYGARPSEADLRRLFPFFP
jgi:LmbE family N-acetylglucosaminyl deacetylase